MTCRYDERETPRVHMGKRLALGIFQDQGRLCVHTDPDGLSPTTDVRPVDADQNEDAPADLPHAPKRTRR